MPTALAAVEAVFPGSRLTKSTLTRKPKVTEDTNDIPEDAERVAVIDALRQAYALVAAQRRFIADEVIVGLALDAALTAIATVAKTMKGNE